MSEIARNCFVSAVFVLGSACTIATDGGGGKRTVDLGEVYDEAAREHGPGRRPVILIPGILGSQLRESGGGQLVWAEHLLKSANPNTPEGLRLLGLPMEKGVPLSALRDDVEAFGVLDKVKISLLFATVESKAYLGILKTLGIGGYRDEELGMSGAVDYGDDHFTCFQFPYDWRRSSAENAALLGKFIREKKAYVAGEYRKRYGISDYDVKFDIVAHSMGGLVTRYFLRYGDQPLPKSGVPKLTWAGMRDVGKVVLVATPSAGSIKAFQQLLYGYKLGPVKRLSFPGGVLGTMPSIYELLPRERHGVLRHGITDDRMDPLDIANWEAHGWGLFDSKEEKVLASLLPEIVDPAERLGVVRDHVAKCLANARQFQAALDRPVELPGGKRIELFAGDAEATGAFAKYYPVEGAVYVTDELPGDGVVTRYSALMDERTGAVRREKVLKSPVPWSETTFLFSNHLGLTADPVFVDNLLHSLLEER